MKEKLNELWKNNKKKILAAVALAILSGLGITNPEIVQLILGAM